MLPLVESEEHNMWPLKWLCFSASATLNRKLGENEEGALGSYNPLILKHSLIVANMLAELAWLLTSIGR